jgi:hypothetical protein
MPAHPPERGPVIMALDYVVGFIATPMMPPSYLRARSENSSNYRQLYNLSPDMQVVLTVYGVADSESSRA